MYDYRTAFGYPSYDSGLRITNITVPCDYPEDETELVFTRKTATFYQAYLWFGRYLQAQAWAVKVLEEKEAEWLRTSRSDSPFS
jgi:hypothetical protein